MLGENSLEGLLFAMPEVGDPDILASYDWNSGFGVGGKFSPRKKLDLHVPGEHSFL